MLSKKIGGASPKTNEPSMTSDNIILLKTSEEIMEKFFEHLIKIKMFHFQTSSYNYHKSSDQYFLTFMTNMDAFMEIIQQKERLKNTTININVTMIDPNNKISMTNELINLKETLLQIKYADYPGLRAIRDNIYASIEQFIYLLSFV